MKQRSTNTGRAVQQIVLAAALVSLAALAAGCGGGSAAPSVARLGTKTSSGAGGKSSSSGGRTARSATVYAECMTSHGIATSSPGGQGLVMTGNVDPNSPQFGAAEQACRKLLPGGGPKPLTAAQQAQRTKDLVAFSSCVRKHGVSTFPDPNPASQFAYHGSIKLLTSPIGESAFKACRSLLPTLGPQLSIG